MSEFQLPTPPTWGGVLRATAAREWRIELRDKEGLARAALVALGVLLVFQFGFGRGLDFARSGPALVWTAVFFAGAASTLGQFEREENQGQMALLALSAADRSAVLLGKWLVGALTIALTGAATLLLGALIFSGALTLATAAGSVLLIGLGAAGYAGLGLILSLAARESRGGGAAAALLLPLLLPLFIALTQAHARLLADGDFSRARLWLGLAVIFDALFVVAPALLAEELFQD